MKLKRDGLYPLGDWYPSLTPNMQSRLRGRWTGEFRAPKAGEWFLSGAKIVAYRTANDLNGEYHIAEIVEVKVVRTEEVIRVC